MLTFELPLHRVKTGRRVAYAKQVPTPLPYRATPAARSLALGHRIVLAVERGESLDFMAAAHRMGVSDAWVSMLVSLTFLAPDIQEGLLLETLRLDAIQALSLSRLRIWKEQRAALREIQARRAEGMQRRRGSPD